MNVHLHRLQSLRMINYMYVVCCIYYTNLV